MAISYETIRGADVATQTDAVRGDYILGKVAVVKTSPQTVLEDYARLMRMLNYQRILPKANPTILKINISWDKFYPACSTTPWQLEGVVKTMLEDGYDLRSLIPAQNRTVVVDAKKGAVANKHTHVAQKYGFDFVWLWEPSVEWVIYQPQAEMLVLDKVFPEGITIPKLFIGKNALHMPTMKTHVFTGTTGAMKNAFGGLLRENRHYTHSVIHETLVDLLAIQREIHPGLFAVMDGSVSGKGPGPRAMEPAITNYLLASADQVAIDAIAAKMMGFDPMSLKFIRLAHERGLGVGDPQEIEVIGEDISGVNLGYYVGDTFASWGQKLIYHGVLKPFEKFLLRTPVLQVWSFWASHLYYNVFFWTKTGSRRAKEFLEKTEWGQLFQQY
ncbi:MAG: DUF362 domain-containing protein [Abditibacteriales bacterium]|nr:DUF362 domain-containing protein [Abditibacteriales bacterium]MDW8367500.1 DUF362 domain-containing protein [Abditibacteriales bacterium]